MKKAKKAKKTKVSAENQSNDLLLEAANLVEKIKAIVFKEVTKFGKKVQKLKKQ
jgi:hypothetical protein